MRYANISEHLRESASSAFINFSQHSWNSLSLRLRAPLSRVASPLLRFAGIALFTRVLVREGADVRARARLVEDAVVVLQGGVDHVVAGLFVKSHLRARVALILELLRLIEVLTRLGPHELQRLADVVVVQLSLAGEVFAGGVHPDSQFGRPRGESAESSIARLLNIKSSLYALQLVKKYFFVKRSNKNL